MTRSMKAAEVVVIGAGVIGAAITYYLAKAGVEVTLIDRYRPISSGTASQSSAGGVRHQGRVAPEIPLAIYSINLWSNLEAELNADLHYRQDGMTVLIDDMELLPNLEMRVEREQALGLDIRVVKGQELHNLIPGLAPQLVAGSYCPKDGHADPMRTTSALALAAQRHGARLIWNCPAKGLHVEKGKIVAVETPDGDISCQYAILAAGAWTPAIAASVGLDLPIRPGAIQMMVTAPRPHTLDQVLGWVNHNISLKQVPPGNFVIGGGWPGQSDPDSYRTTLRPGSMAKSARTTVRLFPMLAGVSVMRAWVGIEAWCIDDRPIIGPVPSLDGLILATGFSGHGFAISPGVGSLLARYVTTGQLPELLNPFNITRFNRQLQHKEGA